MSRLRTLPAVGLIRDSADQDTWLSEEMLTENGAAPLRERGRKEGPPLQVVIDSLSRDRAGALYSLAGFEDRSALPEVRQLARHEDWDVRATVACLLNRWGEPVTDLLADGDSIVRGCAKWIIPRR